MIYLIRDNSIVYATENIPEKLKNSNNQNSINNKQVWKGTIRLRENLLNSEYITIIDLSYDKSYNNSCKFQYDLTPEYIYNVSILKSNIQKTMRRQLIDACLATTLQLLKQDTDELLRRLSVIILEDSLYNHETYTNIIWLLLAHSKGYKLTEKDVQIIMDATITALMTNYRYDLNMEPNMEQTLQCITPYVVIQLRALYGGLKSDKDFLKRLALRSTSPDFPKSEQYTVKLETIEKFNPICHMIPPSIDFHCCPYLLQLLEVESPSIADIKKVVWWHWSSPNRRQIADETAKEVKRMEEEIRKETAKEYGEIKEFLKQFARKQINRLLYTRKEYVKPITIKDYFIAKS